ncbi:MAG: alpha/beta fold hydrolase [Chloroflexi bacterium]|nr:alpha/beta fold hydrolase [Chloroflexota bacterium]
MPRLSLVLFTLFALAAITSCGGEDPESRPQFATVTPAPAIPTVVPTPQVPPTDTPVPADSIPLPESATLPETDARFEPDLCRIREPQGVIVQCGNLVVPENRSDPNSGTIKLHVMVFGTSSRNPAPDPLLYLAGGPGSSIVETSPYQLPLFSRFLEERDVIVFDQRGVGVSQPGLDCPEDTNAVFDSLNQHLTKEEEKALHVAAMRTCRDRLAREGFDLTGYNTSENAADVRDLRLAMGIQEWNLYGVSYGTRLALATMRDYPQGIRSVTLDSTFPLEVDFYSSIVPNAGRALSNLFDECAANPTCSRAYPDLESKLYAAAAILDEKPGQTAVFNPFIRQTHEVVVTGHRLVDTVFNALYVKDFIPLLPELIYDAAEYEFDMFDLVFGTIVGQTEFRSSGMYFSVHCADEVPFTTRAQVETASISYPQLATYLEPESVFDICGFWGSEPNDIKSNTLNSDIPTLVLAGGFDPITPPEWGRRAEAAITGSHYFEFTSAAHGVLGSSDCSFDITLAFLRTPVEEPDASCIAELPLTAFKTPASVGVTLVPFEDAGLGLRSVVPAGWIQFGRGIHGESTRGVVAVMQQAVPTNAAHQILPAFTQQFGIDIPEEPDQMLELDGLIWDIYRLSLDNRSAAIAISDDDDGMTLFLMLTSEPEGHEALYRNVFLPTLAEIDVLQPQ